MAPAAPAFFIAAMSSIPATPPLALYPAVRSHAPIERVYPHGYALAAEAPNGLGHKLRLCHCGRADYHAPDAERIHRLKLCHAAQAAAELNLKPGFFAELPDDLRVFPLAGFRPVKINDVHYLRPGGSERSRHLERIVRHLVNRGEVALIKPHAAAVLQIYGRKYFHQSLSSPKFLSIISPFSPLFSGWNCAP